MKPPPKASKSRSPAHLRLVGEPLPDSAHLDEVAAKIRACRRSEAASVVMQQFEAGRLILAIQEDAKYRDAGVQKLALKLKRTPKSLYRLSARAKAFPPDFVVAAVATAATNNYVLQVSIFDAVVSLENEHDRLSFVELAIKEGWTVRQLRFEACGSSGLSNRRAGVLTPRIVGRAEALIEVLEAVPSSKRALHPSDRERVLAALVKLQLAVDNASQRLKVAEVPNQIPAGQGDKNVVGADRPGGSGAS